jgi:hypothetical protein
LSKTWHLFQATKDTIQRDEIAARQAWLPMGNHCLIGFRQLSNCKLHDRVDSVRSAHTDARVSCVEKPSRPIAYLIAAAAIAVAIWATIGGPLPTHPDHGLAQKQRSR